MKIFQAKDSGKVLIIIIILYIALIIIMRIIIYEKWPQIAKCILSSGPCIHGMTCLVSLYKFSMSAILECEEFQDRLTAGISPNYIISHKIFLSLACWRNHQYAHVCKVELKPTSQARRLLDVKFV